MFIDGAVRRRLASLLRPWLREEPELELELGLINTRVTARNLRFDQSVLTRILDESSRFSFAEFTVDLLTFRFSNWSAPAFKIEAHGVNVVLSVREVKEKGNLRRGRRAQEEKKKALAEIDPEGSALHDVLTKIFDATASRSCFKTSLLNLVLKHCHLEMFNTNLQVQIPILNDGILYFLELKELNAESQYYEHGCLCRGLIGAVFKPMREVAFVVDFRDFGIGYKMKDQMNRFFPSANLFIGIKLIDLQLVEFSIRIPALSMLVTPFDLRIFSASSKLLLQESKVCGRNGRQLWRLAANRLNYAISPPILSLLKLVEFVCIWIRYLNTYECLLSVLGYSADFLTKESSNKIFQNQNFQNSIKHNWEMISSTENKLPAEAIAQARRIARRRASLKIQHGEDSHEEFSINRRFKVYTKILPILVLIVNFVYGILRSIVYSFFLIESLFQEPKLDGHLVNCSKDYCPQYYFLLSIGNISLTIYPTNMVQNVDEIIDSRIGIAYSDLHSFSLSTDALLLVYINNIFEQALSVSCEPLRVKQASFREYKIIASGSGNPSSSMRDHKKGRVDNLETILQCEPTQMFLPSQTSEATGGGENEDIHSPLLKKFLGEMWLTWKTSCMKYDDNEIEYSENLWLLCEIKNSLSEPGLKSSFPGYFKCSLIVGKLNLALSYSSILSMAMLLGQIQHALNWTEDKRRASVPSCFLPTNEDQLDLEGKYELYEGRMKMSLLKMLPEKRIQLGVFITGPRIQMSLKKAGITIANKDMNHLVSQDDFHLGIDILDIEAIVCPSLECDVTSTGLVGANDAELPSLQEPNIIEIPKSYNKKYAAQWWVSLNSHLRVNGLVIYVGDSTEQQQNQLFLLKPVTVQISLFRESVHSFNTTINAFSISFSGTAAGFSLISYMDELYVQLQVVAGLFSAVLYAFGSFSINDYVPHQESRQSMICTECENDGNSAKGEFFICFSCLFSINGTFKFDPMDIVLQNSKLNDKPGSSITMYNSLSSEKWAEHDLPNCGIWISIHHIYFEVACEKGKLNTLLDLLGIRFVIFRHQDLMGDSFDHSMVRNLQKQSHCWLYEISLSSCTFALWLGQSHNSLNNSFGNDDLTGDAPYTVDNSPLVIDSESSSSKSVISVLKLGSSSNVIAPDPGNWIMINVTMGEIFVARCSVKYLLVRAHQFNKLRLLLSVGKYLQTISWKIQGGLLFFDSRALEVFVQCFKSYLHCIEDLLSMVKPPIVPVENAEHEAQVMTQTIQQPKWKLPEALAIDVSQFSLVLVVEDDPGKIQEMVMEVDFHTNLKSENMLRKFIFDFTHVSIFSQVIKECVENKNKIPHFSSHMSNDLSPHFASGDSAMTLQHEDESITSHRNQILNHLVAVIAVEKSKNGPAPINQIWVGNGSVSGFDMTISLSEIQMIASIISSFSAASGVETTSDLKQRHWSNNQETDSSLEDMIADGSIVSIQDVNQHMYLAVEGRENKYSLVGVIHYSLLGERALFRVKHHKQRIWRSSILWFSLISLYAKDASGKPLRLCYSPGSGFVDIASTNDNRWSLWRTLACEPESHKSDIDWEPYDKLVKDTFYLVNKKNDSAVAFVDGIPEFVAKPGNPFKFKVFRDIALACEVERSNRHFLEASGANIYGSTHVNESGSLPCIHIKIDSVTLTVVDELPVTKDRFFLLRCCINDTQLDVQRLAHKTRVMSTSSALLYYFDAQRDSWKELVHPVEICTFYRSNFKIQGSDINKHRMPVHIYCRTKGLDISLTELSLDILLFVIGKLNLAGPFAVRSSMILANCCKVDNRSGLDLLFQFYNEKSVTIAGKQSASLFLRHPVSANRPLQNVPVVTIQLSSLGSFATSSLHFSTLKTQTLAWRTRIMSLQDSRNYPGPFVVVDISRESEDALSIVVSPLTRIHNETEFSMELRFRRPQEDEDTFASVLLKKGDSIDDSMATFDAISLSGGLRKALMSLSVGNFLFSFRPEITNGLTSSSLSVEWSDELKGGKAVRLSGIFDKLGYEVRRVLSVESMKYSFSTACCTLKSGDRAISDLHFLIQSIARDVPITDPDKSSDGSGSINSAVALREQREIFLLPTMRVSNLLHLEIHVVLDETDDCTTVGSDNIGKQATIPCGSTVDFYVNPAIIYFTVTLTTFSSSCKPVNSGDWVKKLVKNRNAVRSLDIDLDFSGKYFASLRLSRGLRGVLEAAIFTPYSLKNGTDFSLLLLTPNQKPPSRDELMKFGSDISPEFGIFLPPNSIRSWLLKSHKMHVKLLEDLASEALLDLDALSGLTEISLELEEGSQVRYIIKFGVSVGPSNRMMVPSQMVTMVPRHVLFNESDESITVRQCYLEDEMAGMIIDRKQRKTLKLRKEISKLKEFSVFENIIKKHRNDIDTSLVHIQFHLNEPESCWSGPVCIASLGHFFLKFRKRPNQAQVVDNNAAEFAAVHVVEEGSTLGLHFQKPPKIDLPYRIENHLHNTSVTYHQKDSPEREVLGADCSAFYAWDDLTLPHKLVVFINDDRLLREINLDKVRVWKPFLKMTQRIGLASPSVLSNKSRDQKSYLGQLNSTEIVKLGYEIYAEGPTRVLRICEFSDSHKGGKVVQSAAKIQLRISHFAVHLLEHAKQELNKNEEFSHTPIVVANLGNINLDSVFTEDQKFNHISVQSFNVDLKWMGAPFAAMLRRHQSDFSDSNTSMLKIVFVMLSTSSSVRQVKYSSIVLQPIDWNVDEETLMRVASFWRTSLSDSNTPSKQYYFDHFEVHPIKIIANFLPGESYSSYNSAQETLRSLLHSIVKVPPIKNMVVELNGVLVTHALITLRELSIRCAQHYSWYALRAIYIAKGSPLLPPAFASIFDDLASSSLDVFFDPSRGLINLPGFTLGTFKFLSKCIDGKGFSGTKRYFGDLEKTFRTVGSNVLFTAVTEISDSVLKGAETSGFDGMVTGFHQGIMKLAMEPSVLGTAVMGGGPDRKIQLDQSPGVEELYIEGYLQAMLDTMYRQEYLRVRVIDDQVFLKNLPPNSALIDEIMDRVKGFLVSKALLKGDASTSSRPLRHLRGESEWKIGPTVITLCEHLLVSFAIRTLRKQTGKVLTNINWKMEPETDDLKAVVPAEPTEHGQKVKFIWKWGIGNFVLSGILAYIDGRLCRCIPNPVARRIVSGFLLSFLDKNNDGE